MSDTPRTNTLLIEQNYIGGELVPASFAQQLERELNAAHSVIRQQQLLDEENLGLKQRIKRLEEALENIKFYANTGVLQISFDEILRIAQEAKP